MSTSNKNERHEIRLSLMKSKANLIVANGKDYPFTLDELIQADASKDYVEKAIENGLSAYVYKLVGDGKAYALKVERETSLVHNLDGETAFVNELLVRQDIEKFRQEGHEFPELVETYYADKNQGLVLSNWIDGETPMTYNRNRFRSLFEGLFELEQVGYFEWDLCPANLMFDDQDHITFYDFGYTYPFDLLSQIHSDSKDNMAMHMVERFETRAFVQHLIDMEKVLGLASTLKLFRIEKEEALRIYKIKHAYIDERKGHVFVLDFLKAKIKEFEEALSSKQALVNQYICEVFRSSLFDVYDDLSAPLASLDTYSKILKVVDSWDKYRDLIREKGYLFFGDESLDDYQLTRKYKDLKEKVESLLKDEKKEAHAMWKEKCYEMIKKAYQ